MDITTPGHEPFPAGVASTLEEAVSVKPNNALLGSAKYRIPIPYGLWVYNNWPNPPRDSSIGYMRSWPRSPCW